MTEDKMIEYIDALLVFFSIFMFYGFMLMIPTEVPKSKDMAIKSEIIPPPEYFYQKPKASEAMRSAVELLRKIDTVEISYTTIEYSYIGTYFVTAYSDEETWSRMTASGEEVHWSDSNFEPTTAAIDRNYHGFYEYLAVDFGDYKKVYVTEDTGAFRGKWIDCFVETMEEVNSWPTGYYPIYSVEYVEHTLSSAERLKRHELTYYYFYDRSFIRRLYSRDDYRAPFRQ